jgi:hypothetical protein
MSKRFSSLCELHQWILRFEAFFLADSDGGTTLIQLRFVTFHYIKILSKIRKFLNTLLLTGILDES